MFQETIKGDSREVQGYLKVVHWVFQGIFNALLSVECGSRKFQIKVQECFNGVLFWNFLVAWISSQLLEQKEGLFRKDKHSLAESRNSHGPYLKDHVGPNEEPLLVMDPLGGSSCVTRIPWYDFLFFDIYSTVLTIIVTSKVGWFLPELLSKLPT